MAKEASVAPKERVNIVYRPATGAGQEETELPLKMLVLGDFTGTASETPVENREPVAIDKGNFNEVLKAQRITLALSVPNFVVEGEDELDLSLRVESLKDLEPESIADQVPELRRLLELREALRAIKGPLSNVPAFGKKIQDVIADATARHRLLGEVTTEKGGPR